MQSPKSNRKMISPNAKTQTTKTKDLSPPSQKNNGFKAKTFSDLKVPKQPSPSHSQLSHKSHFSKHEHSFTTLYSKHKQHQVYEHFHDIGYSGPDIHEAVEFIFKKYDTNKDNLLDRQQVKKLLTSSIQHMGNHHIPSDLEVLEFILSIDKNNDGKLSREELEKAFKRANKIEY